MSYEITTYKEGYIEDQFKIGSAIYDRWRMGGQTRISQLKEVYSKTDFDPETRFYAFLGDEMVGFLTSSDTKGEGEEKKAYYEFPFVKPGHEEVIDKLIKYSMKALKAKGFDTLITRAGVYWGNTRELAEKYGFKFEKIIVRAAELHLDEFDVSELDEPVDILEYDYNRDIDDLAEFFAKRFDSTTEKMKNTLNRFKDLTIGATMKNPWEQQLNLVSSIIGRVGGELVSRGVAMNIEPYGNKNVNIVAFYIKEGHENLKSQMMRKIIEDCHKMEFHRIIVQTGLWGLNPVDSYFEPFGFKFNTKLAYYYKKL